MKQSNAGKSGGTAGSLGGASSADLDRGYMKGKASHDAYPMYGPGEWAAGEDDMGNTYVGNARTRGGFLTRPQGEER